MYISALVLALARMTVHPFGHSLISILVLKSALDRKFISILELTNPLGCRLIPALVPAISGVTQY